MTSQVEKKIDRYAPAAIEEKWRERWVSSGLHNTPDVSDKPNFYFLTMFPYPSGEIHVGHWYAFAPPDAAARFLRMRGHNVLFPMGFDAFGINAENAAIDRKMHPAVWTEKNMAHMREQFNRMGAAIDWRREVVTCYPEYYRWNQWMFLKLFEKGLAYRGDAPVNWCPRDETVLANEQVINGRCERCDTPVVKRQMTQWFYRITKYADELLRFEGLDWPERVRTLQTNWIGRSEGAEMTFPVEGHPGEEIRFFTTRPDTIYGATFMVLAPEHPLVEKIVAPKHRAEVDRYVQHARNMAEIERTVAEREKTGVDTGAFARNVFTGERAPIWVADYVLATYGTGAIMAVPGHDERDFAFAKKHRLEIREVISPDGSEHASLDAPYVGEGVMVRSGPFSGMRSEVGKAAVAAEAKKRGIGGPSVTYRLHDWLISRQRYWGTPIPIVHCERCGAVPVPYDQLPVVLPRDVEFTGRGGSPLSHVASFVNTTCPKCGGPARRDTDTMDTFVDSSWYMYRYVDPKYEKAFMNAELGKKWLPVQQYTGGVEHAILHLLYMRFMAKALRDMGELWFDEPAIRFRYQGTIVFKGRKMSKSRGNVQTPDAYVEKYGADTLRLFMMFMGPWVDGADWDAAGIEGVHRFLRRVWEMAQSEAQPAGPRDPDLDRAVHRTIAKVTDDLQTYSFNTAVAAMMELSNALHHAAGPSRDEGVATLLLLLAPFAPYVTEELWERRGGRASIHQQRWPAFDPAIAAANEVTLVIQIDGKVRDRITAAAGISQSAAEDLAKASPKVKAALDGREPARTIFVPDRLVNFVTRRPS
ncbi:MAG TPA: leucine--tRNA ligase [Candidatus Bathyarchaeia archaeon]|nr:leucine--tRNA ligase [Candidatus Bathyarchaeia archaeon]